MRAATCALAASVLAATTAALATTSTSAADATAAASSSSSEVSGRPSRGCRPGVLSKGNPSNLKGKKGVVSSSEKDKFAPRFDGLRFIETLVRLARRKGGMVNDLNGRWKVEMHSS